jgi:hypothetical protein
VPCLKNLCKPCAVALFPFALTVIVALSTISCSDNTPTINLVVPDGYRGIIILVSSGDGAEGEWKDKTVTFRIPESGKLAIRDGELIGHKLHNLTAEYDSGKHLPVDGEPGLTADDEHVLRKAGDNVLNAMEGKSMKTMFVKYFIVGTYKEQEEFYDTDKEWHTINGKEVGGGSSANASSGENAKAKLEPEPDAAFKQSDEAAKKEDAPASSPETSGKASEGKATPGEPSAQPEKSTAQPKKAGTPE